MDYNELKAGAEEIKNNTLPDSNTAGLVGGELLNIVEKLSQVDAGKASTADLQEEIRRATAAEEALSQSVNQTRTDLTKAVSDEENRAKAAEQQILNMLTSGRLYKGLALENTIPDDTLPALYLATLPGTYVAFGDIRITEYALYTLTNVSDVWELTLIYKPAGGEGEIPDGSIDNKKLGNGAVSYDKLDAELQGFFRGYDEDIAKIIEDIGKNAQDISNHVGKGGVDQHPLASGAVPGFSQNNYMDAEKNKLALISTAQPLNYQIIAPNMGASGQVVTIGAGCYVRYNDLSGQRSQSQIPADRYVLSPNQLLIYEILDPFVKVVNIGSYTSYSVILAYSDSEGNVYLYNSIDIYNKVKQLQEDIAQSEDRITSHIGKGGTDQHPLASGAVPGFSQNNYMDAEKNKLALISTAQPLNYQIIAPNMGASGQVVTIGAGCYVRYNDLSGQRSQSQIPADRYVLSPNQLLIYEILDPFVKVVNIGSYTSDSVILAYSDSEGNVYLYHSIDIYNKVKQLQDEIDEQVGTNGIEDGAVTYEKLDENIAPYLIEWSSIISGEEDSIQTYNKIRNFPGRPFILHIPKDVTIEGYAFDTFNLYVPATISLGSSEYISLMVNSLAYTRTSSISKIDLFVTLNSDGVSTIEAWSLNN